MISSKRQAKWLRHTAWQALGWLLLVAGFVGLVAPGPGLLMIVGGLAVLSQQYEWPKRHLRPIKIRAFHAAAVGVQTWPRIIASTLFALGIIGFGIIWTTHPAVPSWWPLADHWWLPGGLATGISLMLSGVIAVGLVGYSFFKFHGIHPEKAAQDAADSHPAEQQSAFDGSGETLDEVALQEQEHHNDRNQGDR